MDDNKLKSLISLLDDPDDSVIELVERDIMKSGISAVDHLEHFCETSLDSLVQKRIKYIVQQIQLIDTKERIDSWANLQPIDLFDGFFLISRHRYPELKLRPIQIQLEKIKKDILIELRNSLSSLEKITVLNHIFFDLYHFDIERDNPNFPNLCFMNRVLESRKGNPISIAILYKLIAQSVSLPVCYIDIPNGPLLAYFEHETSRLAQTEKQPVIFYINPSNRGAIIGPKEVGYLQPLSDLSDKTKLTEPCANRIIIKRLLEKLIFAYNQLGAEKKVFELEKIALVL